jgi:hypothetical protein
MPGVMLLCGQLVNRSQLGSADAQLLGFEGTDDLSNEAAQPRRALQQKGALSKTKQSKIR